MTPPHFTPAQVTVIVRTAYSSSLLSLIGSSFSIYSYIAFKDARNYGTSLVFNLAISNFCTASANVFLVYLVDEDVNNLWCTIQASMLLFGLVANMMWELVIGIHLFLVLCTSMEIEKIKKYRWAFRVFAWGYPIAASIVPLVKNGYILMFPNAMAWCFVPDPYRMLLFFPDTAVFFLLALSYCVIWLTLCNAHNTAAQEICSKMIPQMYLLTYTLLNVFGITNRVQDFVSPGNNIFVLYLLQFIFEPLQGFMNAIAYVWNEPAFIEHYKQLFTRCKTQHVTRAALVSIFCDAIRKTGSMQAEHDRLMSLVQYESEP